MLAKYTTHEISKIWSEENEFSIMLEIEVAVAEKMSHLGEIPNESFANIKSKAKFQIERIKELEKENKHDLISFIQNVAENIGDDGKYLHKGLTSSDVKDTTFAIELRQSGFVIKEKLETLYNIVLKRAKEFKYTPMIGRTHGVHAEPITFGLKLLVIADEVSRNIERMNKAIENISYGKISGAVGTYANINPEVEKFVCTKLNLKHERISTQIIQRDRHAEFLTTLAIISSSLEKFATEIRNLQRTEIREIEESFSKKQKGSSAMPHKRNPIICERISGLSRILRGNVTVALENNNLWHERDLSHSSTERLIFPDSLHILQYTLDSMIKVFENLNVFPNKMLENIYKTGGIVFSQRVLLKLIEKGLSRDEAYLIVQKNAMDSWNEISNMNYEMQTSKIKTFKERVFEDTKIVSLLTKEEIESCFTFDYYIKHVDEIFSRF